MPRGVVESLEIYYGRTGRQVQSIALTRTISCSVHLGDAANIRAQAKGRNALSHAYHGSSRTDIDSNTQPISIGKNDEHGARVPPGLIYTVIRLVVNQCNTKTLLSQQ